MDLIRGIIIGIVQGLTEFLPVSSSAHLVFIQNILGVESSLAFDVFLHLGTLIAVLWFFRWDIIKMIKSWWLSIGDIEPGGRQSMGLQESDSIEYTHTHTT